MRSIVLTQDTLTTVCTDVCYAKQLLLFLFLCVLLDSRSAIMVRKKMAAVALDDELACSSGRAGDELQRIRKQSISGSETTSTSVVQRCVWVRLCACVCLCLRVWVRVCVCAWVRASVLVVV